MNCIEVVESNWCMLYPASSRYPAKGKIMRVVLIAALASLLVVFSLNAAEEPVVIGDVVMPAAESSAAFQMVQKKVGKWEGKMTQGATGKIINVSYEWRVTSGGKTITETLVEDGVEMLTTYADRNGELVVKHYCALGTQPVFKVSNLSETELAIALDESAFFSISSGISSDSNNFNQSISSEVEGFFFKPGIFLRSKNISNASLTNFFLILG